MGFEIPMLVIPVMALATALVAVIRMPKEAFLPPKPKEDSARQVEALEEEVVRLRLALADAQERLDFTERLLDGRPAPALPGRSADALR